MTHVMIKYYAHLNVDMTHDDIRLNIDMIDVVMKYHTHLNVDMTKERMKYFPRCIVT